MNILILSPYPPYPPHGGGTMRIYQIIRDLATRHRVTCLSFVPDAAAERELAPLHHVCRLLTVRGPLPRSIWRRAWTTLFSPLPDMALRNAAFEYAQALEALLAAERFDIIQAESIEMASYLPNPALGVKSSDLTQNSELRTLNSKLVLDQFNAEYVLQRRAFLTDVRRPRRWLAAAYSLAQSLKLLRYERRIIRSCAAVVTVSEEDRDLLRKLAPDATFAVVPNGVDTAHFSRAAADGDRAGPLVFCGATIVFSGTLDFRPNVDAVIWFAQQVLPRIRARWPNARLIVVGKRPAPALRRLAASGILILTGEVPDARPYIIGASAYVVPMRIGGGVRLKLLEALSLEAPVVTTSMGAEGVAGLRGDLHCLLADDPAKFADSVLRLLGAPALGRRLGAAGRALVRERYDWATIVPRLEELYQDLVPEAC